MSTMEHNSQNMELDKQTPAMAEQSKPVLIDPVSIGAVSFAPLTMQQTLKQVSAWVEESRECRQILVANAWSCVLTQDLPDFADIAAQADLSIADGKSVVWGARILGKLIPERLAGPDFMWDFLGVCEAKGWPCFFLGGTEQSMPKMRENLLRHFPNLQWAGDRVPPFGEWPEEEHETILHEIQQSGARVIWVGVGSPKQDRWISRFRERLPGGIAVGVGAAFDFYSGDVKRAPLWMQKAGLEWLHRFAGNPRRLWKRYLWGNVRFLGMLLRQRFLPLLLACLGVLALPAQAAFYPEGSARMLSAPYTLKGPSAPQALEWHHHQQLFAEEFGLWMFPLPMNSGAANTEMDSFRLMERDSAGNFLAFRPVLGGESRRIDAHLTNQLEGGLVSRGRMHTLNYVLDARIFTEYRDRSLASYDREFVEKQQKGTNASFDFLSYARYRVNFSWDSPVGRFETGRDAPHWGPAVYFPLMLSGEAVPYPWVSWGIQFGDFAIKTLYASLTIDGTGRGLFANSQDTRSMYAHRYEWRFLPNWLFGISETLFLFNHDSFVALLPAVPLFMEKGNTLESYNNGNLSLDLSYRLPGLMRFYTEFLLDDVSELSQLFGDFYGNKWAWTAGMQGTLPWSEGLAGYVLEYSRVEPWVYTHYQWNTAQAAHRGFPVGQQLGPNSQAVKVMFYGRHSALSWSLSSAWIWKGNDDGSSVSDTLANNEWVQKEFLQGVDHPEIQAGPSLGYELSSGRLDAGVLWKGVVIPGESLQRNAWNVYLRGLFWY